MLMNLGDWLDQERGRLAMLAERFGVSMSAVSQWRSKGVPAHRMLDVRAATLGAVTLEEMLASKPAKSEAA